MKVRYSYIFNFDF